MKGFLYNLPFKNKFYLSLLLVILLSFTVFGAINNVFLTNDYKTQAENSIQSNLEQTGTLLSYRTSIIKYGTDIFVYQFAGEDYFSATKDSFITSPGLYEHYRSQIESELFTIRNIPTVQSAALCMNNDLANLYSQDDIYSLNDYSETTWYNKIIREGETYVWTKGGIEEKPVTSPYITLIRRIYNPQELNITQGVIAINVLASSFEEALSNACDDNYLGAFIINSDKNLISSYTKTPDFDSDELISTAGEYSNGPHYVNIGDDKYLVSEYIVAQSDWTFIICVPYSSIRKSILRIYSGIPLTLLLLLPIVSLIALLLSNRITKPIQVLKDNMKLAEAGNFDIPIAPYYKDEIGQLNRSFNVLLTKLSLLLDEKYKMGKEIKNAQLKALQNQINPHFLYNTLDLINLLAINGENEKIQDAIQSLSRFYRLSLNNGQDKTTLGQELDHVTEYVHIQNLRFDDRIKLCIDVDSSLLDIPIFKLCLQPIVENAIYHGIFESESQEGSISIGAHSENDDVIITVSDDGIGMPPEKLDGLLSAPPQNKKGGYGLYNINERIKLSYGPNYGITCESTQGHGTTITIKIKNSF